MADDDVVPLVVQLEARLTTFEKQLAKAQAIADKQFGAVEARTSTAGRRMETAMAESTNRVNASLGRINFSKLTEFAGERAAHGFEGLTEQFVSLGKAVLLPIAGLATLEGAVEAFKGQIERADTAGKLSESLGLSVESLTQLQHAADMADISTDDLSTGLRQLAKNALDVAQGAKGGAAPAFRQLGITVTDAAGHLKSTNVLFDQVAEKFAHMQTGAAKTGLAMQIFGRSGAQLIPVLNEGRDGLKELADESDRLGLTISGTTAAAAAELADKTKLLGDRLQGVVATVTADALPAFNALVDQFQSLLDDGPLMDTLFGVLEGGVRDLTSFMVQLAGAIKQVDELLTGLASASEALRRGEGFNAFFVTMRGAMQDFNNTAAETDKLAKAILAGTPLPQSKSDSWHALVAGFKGNGTGEPQGSSPRIVGSGAGADAAGKKIDTTTAALQRQIAALTETSRQQAEQNALAQAGITINDKAAAGIIALADNLFDQKQAMQASNTAASALAETTASAFEGMLDGSESLSGALGSLASALEKMVIQAALLGTGPLAGLFGTAPAIAGAPAGLLGSLASSLLSGLHLAGGGPVRGAGGPTSDSVPALLSDGEFVVNASATARYGSLLDAINNGSIDHFAAGGPVSPNLRPVNDNAGPPLVINAPVTVNASGGTPQQNADLAKQMSKQLESTIRGLAADEILKSQKVGNIGFRRR